MSISSDFLFFCHLFGTLSCTYISLSVTWCEYSKWRHNEEES